VEKHFEGEVPKVMNDFLRKLSALVGEVLKTRKKVPDDAVRGVMKMCHKTGVCKGENEFFIFAHNYLPTSFERIAFIERKFVEDYYDFK
jgi:hypothetical protein